MKYPWIEKRYYPAVMFACKLIRENGYFNKAIKASAKYYKVDEETLKSLVRERQAAGQRGKKRGTYKTYRFKGTAEHYFRERFYGDVVFDVKIKALSLKNARKRLAEKVVGKEYDPYEEDLLYNFEIDGEEVSND